MPHLDDIKERIDNVGQIEGVILAMRAMAVAHAQEARRHLKAIREHEDTVARAMAEATSLVPAGALAAAAREEEGAHLHLVIGAAQGFSGLYNDKIVSGVLDRETIDADDRFMLVGQRCVSEFAARGKTPDWSANMVAHAAEVPALASRMVDALFTRLDSGEVHRVSIVFADPDSPAGDLVFRQLMPFDFSRIARAQGRFAPITTMDPGALIENLVEEYVFTEICEALMLGFAAENDARMNAMTRARSNVKHIAQDLQRKYHQARQEETTTEIIELSQAT